jgi:hypothetical protein
MARALLYGFLSLKDLAAQRVTTVGVSIVGTAIAQSLEEHNRQIAALQGLFVEPTTDYQVSFKSTVASRLQPLDEGGRARPIKGPALYTAAYPLQMAGSAWGADWVTRQKMSVQEVNDQLSTIFEADMRWVRDHILGGLFQNVDWTFTDDVYGSLTVKPLANADSVTYPILPGADAGTTDNHYLATASAIADATDPFPAMLLELQEHPGNGRPFIALVPTNLMSAVTALSLYIPIPVPEVAPPTTATQITGTLNVPTPGVLRGLHKSGIWIVEWASLPDNYIVGVAAGAAEKPLRVRQDEEPELQGLIPVDIHGNGITRTNWPWQESQYVRREGYGAWNRIAALVQRFGSGSYAIPTGYAAPMP